MHKSRGLAAGVMLPVARVSALFGASIAIMLAVSGWQTPPALAGTLAVLSCKSPSSGVPEPIEGWKSYWTGGPFPDAGADNGCQSASTGLESYVSDSEPQPGSAGPGWEYTAPAGDEIIGGTVAAEMWRGSASGYIGAVGIIGPQYEFDAANLIAAAEWAPEGSDTTYTLNGHNGTHIWTYAFCEPPGETCPTGASNRSDWAQTDLTAADIELSNNSTPTGTGFGGQAAGTSAMSGTQSLVFQAGDSGSSAPGVYAVKATLNGQSIYDATPNTNEGKCVALGSYQGGPVKEFAYPQPCKSSESVTIPVNSAAVKDGTHELVVTVIDAAGNEDVVYSHALTSDNAPVVLSTPAVSGVAELGSTLTATNGTFSAPEGAGTLSSASGQWLRCSDAAATHCSPISEATSPTYQPKADDVGYYLVYANTVSDSDGSTTSDSQPTTAVTAASAAPSCVSGECLHGGTGGNGGTGGSGGAGGTGNSGGQGAGGSGSLSGGSSSGSGVTVQSEHPRGNCEPNIARFGCQVGRQPQGFAYACLQGQDREADGHGEHDPAALRGQAHLPTSKERHLQDGPPGRPASSCSRRWALDHLRTSAHDCKR